MPSTSSASPDADRAQADPDRGQHHVHPCHPRPGGGHDHGRHHRGDERRRDRADGCSRRALREPPHHLRGELPRSVQPDRRQDPVPRRRDHGRHAGHHRHGLARTDARRGTDGWVGIRPEKVLIGDEGESLDAPGNTIPGWRRHRRQLRRRQHAVPRPDAVGPGDAGLRAEHRPPRIFRYGDKVELSWRPEYAFLLDHDQDASAGSQIDDE